MFHDGPNLEEIHNADLAMLSHTATRASGGAVVNERPLGVEHYKLVHFNLRLGGPNSWLEVRLNDLDEVVEATLKTSGADGQIERRFSVSEAQILYDLWKD